MRAIKIIQTNHSVTFSGSKKEVERMAREMQNIINKMDLTNDFLTIGLENEFKKFARNTKNHLKKNETYADMKALSNEILNKIKFNLTSQEEGSYIIKETATELKTVDDILSLVFTKYKIDKNKVDEYNELDYTLWHLYSRVIESLLRIKVRTDCESIENTGIITNFIIPRINSLFKSEKNNIFHNTKAFRDNFNYTKKGYNGYSTLLLINKIDYLLESLIIMDKELMLLPEIDIEEDVPSFKIENKNTVKDYIHYIFGLNDEQLKEIYYSLNFLDTEINDNPQLREYLQCLLSDFIGIRFNKEKVLRLFQKKNVKRIDDLFLSGFGTLKILKI